MKNPLDRDVIAANAVAVGTGFKAYRDGMPGLDAFNVGMWWRWWYKNLTMSFVLFGIVLIICTQTGQWGFLVAQGVLNILVIGITYCSLINVSQFKRRWFFRVWWPLAKHFPYTARFWFYLTLFLPLWSIMWFRCLNFEGNALTW